jgi:hypothetical protein
MGATQEEGNVHPSGAHDFTLGFLKVRKLV